MREEAQAIEVWSQRFPEYLQNNLARAQQAVMMIAFIITLGEIM